MVHLRAFALAHLDAATVPPITIIVDKQRRAVGHPPSVTEQRGRSCWLLVADREDRLEIVAARC
eukprot:SAG31_NODE_2760_length_5133_cov_12.708582_6_plen_64_part_00